MRTLAAAALATVLTACGAAPSGRVDAPKDSAPAVAAALPLREGAVDRAVAGIDAIAGELMETSGIPGMAVAVVHGGETIYAKGFGVRDTRTGQQVDADTVFQLASLSKPIAATVVARQAGTSEIGWDTPVTEALDWFALSDPAVTRMLTVGDLFAHRSGLPDHAGDLLEDLGYDRDEILRRLRLLPLAPFRVSYAYTNFGVTAAAEAVAAAAGKAWADLSEEVLYRPLGMSSTSSRFADYQSRPDRAVGHVRDGSGFQPRYTRDPDAQSPAGGVSASVNDVARWLAMVLAEGRHDGTSVVDPEALRPALTPQMVSNPPTEPAMRPGFYGYGFNITTSAAGRMQFSHSGAFLLGAATNFVIIPSADVAIVALTNAAPSGIPETLTAEFTDLVEFGEVRTDWRALYAEAFGAIDSPVGELAGARPPADPAPARPAAAYTGSYANDYWGPATVSETGGVLTLALGPRPVTYPLTHWDGDVFTFSPGDENAPPGSLSAARFDGDSLTLEYFDADGMGTFTR